MKRILLIILIAGSIVANGFPKKQQTVEITFQTYQDKIKAMWLAQLIAVHMGWEFEHKPAAVKFVDDYPEYRKKIIEENDGAQVDDDWYYEMVALDGFEKYGTDMTVEELGQQWLDYDMGTWGSAFYTRQALLNGLKGADAGHPKNNRMWFTVGNQNRSDLYAMITPAMPNLTASVSRELGHVNSYAEGTDGGVLMGVLESTAFYIHDVKQLMKTAVQVLHPAAPHRQCFEMIIQMGETGKSWIETARAVEERWGIEYPGTNSAVWNAGFAGVALWFGDGDFMKSINIAYQASDFSDADCQAANVATILAAMYGTSVFPEYLVSRFNNHIKGTNLGFMKLVEPVNENLDTLTMRTFRIGLQMMQKHGATIKDEKIAIPLPGKIIEQPAETFHPNEFTRWWNSDWKLERAGFGAPGGGVRGVRGGTFLDGEILSTYPRDEIRGVKLFSTVEVKPDQKLKFEVAADPGRKWKLTVLIDHKKVFTQLVDGGPALEWDDIDELGYPQPLHEYERSAAVRQWLPVEIDLNEYAGQQVVIRLYQDILVRNGFPGNAYWRTLHIADNK